uniref:Novel immune-type receptor 3a n=1 Tax=Cyprinus carpio TaxID=7962 RepID=A0A8C1TT24_CYPCA
MFLWGYFLIILLLFLDGTCEIKGVIHQLPLVVAELGSSVILPCSYSFDLIHTVSWFKQTVGKKLFLLDIHLISQEVLYIKMALTSIINLKENDFANYFCAVTFISTIQFGEGTILLHKDSANGSTVLQQPVSDRLHPGDSVTLQCSVISQICAGEYSVYWFRHSSGHSNLGLIYTHDNRSDQCMDRSENGFSSQSCVYSLSQTELRPSDAGVYYCAVVACGKIHFGNGTKLIVEASSTLTFWNPVVLTLFTISIISIIVNIFLVRLIHKNHKKESNAVNYVALSFSKRLTTSKRSSGKTSQEETVYSQITKQ